MSDIAVGRGRAGWQERLGAAEAVPAGLDARRVLRLGLAAIWLLDGVLQYQDGVTSVRAEDVTGLPGAGVNFEAHDFY